MPIRQPLQTTVHTSDFRDQTYCFTVESVLMSQERIGMLTVSASAGYLITTSFNKDSRREHTFQHYQQADGSWLAEGEVTLIAAGDSLVDGMVTIRNSQGETLILTVDATLTAGVQAQQPVLSVSEPLPAFARTVAGKPSYLVLTIAQQYTNVPITLTTDAPEYFQLASDSRPVFSPALTLIPSATGTHVHVRYVAQKNGVHTGHLIIEAKYESKTIPLRGRSSGLLPTRQTLSLPTNSAMLPQATTQTPSETTSKRWISALALMVVAGLMYTGYTKRCQLFPALCVEAPTSQTNSSDRAIVVTEKPVEKLVTNKIISKPVEGKELSAPTLRTLPPAAPASRALPVESTQERLNGGQSIGLKPTPSRKFAKQESDVQPDKLKGRPKPSVAATEESDLERALNQ